jgi:MSHA pilin protein MshC
MWKLYRGSQRGRKSFGREAGFSLIELIAVMVIIGVLATVVTSSFYSAESARVQTSRDDVIAALFFAQQAGMSRASSTNSIRFVFSSNQISVEENGTPLRNGGVTYPLTIGNGVSLAGSVSSPYSYDKLGRTSAATLTLSSGSISAQVQLSGAGYAY